MDRAPRPRRRRRMPFPPALRLPTLFAAALILFFGVRALFSAPSPPAIAPDWVTQALIPVNPYSRPGEKLEAVNAIVIHYTANPGTTAEQNRSYFAGLADSGETYASSNFIIDLNGEAMQIVPSDEMAYASNQRNNDSLSIEVCHPDDTGAFTPASGESLVRLVQWLVDYYKLDRSQILRHYDVSGKDCPRYFVQHPDEWERFLDQISF